jgi:pilus assembly protein CpaB
MVYRYLRSQQEAVEAVRRAVGGATADVVVANDTIPIGSQIQLNQVRAVRWPLDAQPEGAIRDPKDVVGSVARTTIEKNQAVLRGQLVSQGAGLLPVLITEGHRGMSVKVDNVTGVSGFITPSSRVDVLAAGTLEATGGSRAQRSKLILQNITVLATGTSIEQKDNKPVEVPTVTLLVSPEDAEKLTLATRQEPVRLALRNYRDEAIVETPGSSMAALFGEEKKPPSAPVAAAVAARVRVERAVERRAPAYSVEILLGEKVTHQDFY